MHAGLNSHAAELDRRLSDIGWGLLFILTGVIWIVPVESVPPGTWLFGVAAILLGLNLVRYVAHVNINGFSVILGALALLAAITQTMGTDLPLVAVCLLLIGTSLVIRPLFTKTA